MPEILDRHARQRVAAKDEQAVLVGQDVEELARLVADRRPRQGHPQVDRRPQARPIPGRSGAACPRAWAGSPGCPGPAAGRRPARRAPAARAGRRSARRAGPARRTGRRRRAPLDPPGDRLRRERRRRARRAPARAGRPSSPSRPIGEPVGQRVHDGCRPPAGRAGLGAAIRRTRVVGGPSGSAWGSVSAGRREGSTVTARRIRSLALFIRSTSSRSSARSAYSADQGVARGVDAGRRARLERGVHRGEGPGADRRLADRRAGLGELVGEPRPRQQRRGGLAGDPGVQRHGRLGLGQRRRRRPTRAPGRPAPRRS